MKKKWLVLFPDTFLWIKIHEGIIYNSKNFKYFTFNCSDEIIKLCDTLVYPDNLYSVEISELFLSDSLIKVWIEKISKIEAGCLIEQEGGINKLTSYYPILSIQNGLDQIIWDHKLKIGGKIIENLNELIFYVNGSSNGSDKFFKQLDFPIKTDLSLDFDLIASFVNQCKSRMLNHITFIGDLFNYEFYIELQKWILSNNFQVSIVMLLEDILLDFTKIEWIKSSMSISITVVVNEPSILINTPEVYQAFGEKIRFVFIINSIIEFDYFSSIIDRLDLKNYNIIPLYNDLNHKFFKDNVYMDLDSFENIRLTKREVFANMTLNVHSFGKLYIMPDGNIYSNTNDSMLGSICDPIYDILYKEMTERKTWFRIRDMKPCNECVFQWLCPSPGNYELVLGKPNLCHILTPL